MQRNHLSRFVSVAQQACSAGPEQVATVGHVCSSGCFGSCRNLFKALAKQLNSRSVRNRASNPSKPLHRRSQSLPLSHWHVVLAWLDLVTDVLGALSTRQLALHLSSLCGMRTGPFFNCCFSIQILLVAGSLAAHVLFAVLHVIEEASAKHSTTSTSTSTTSSNVPSSSAAAAQSGSVPTVKSPAVNPPAVNSPAGHAMRASMTSPTAENNLPFLDGPSAQPVSIRCIHGYCSLAQQPQVLKAVLWAVLRGLTATELAYQEYYRRMQPSTRRTAAVMQIRMSELVFEGPQVVISWMVFMGRLTVNELAAVAGVEQPHVATLTKVFQWMSLVVGVLSLSIGCSDFMRLHGRSMWAGQPPSVLFLGLIDVSPGTWHRSALIGAHAVFSLLTRAFIYIMASSMTLILSFFDVRRNRSTAATAAADNVQTDGWPTVALQVVFPGMLMFSLACNAALLYPMKDWTLGPAALINCFVNIPWIAAAKDSPAYGAQRCLLPVAVLQVLCGGAAIALACISLHPVTFLSPCGYTPARITWLGGEADRLAAPIFTFLLPLLAALGEMILFIVLAVLVIREEHWGHAVQAAAAQNPASQTAQNPAAGPSGHPSASRTLARCNTGAPALAYRFIWWRWPYVLCSVRVSGRSALPATSSGTTQQP